MKEQNQRNDCLTITGSGTVEGDVFVVSFVCLGTGIINGLLDALSIDINGMCKANSVISEKIKSNGIMEVGGNIKCKESIDCNGLLDVKGDISANSVHCKGVLVSSGGLTTKEFILEMNGRSKIPKIESELVNVTLQIKGGDLSSDSLKAKNVRIEYSSVNYLEAETAVLGPLCTIDRAKVRDLTVDSSSTVKTRIPW